MCDNFQPQQDWAADEEFRATKQIIDHMLVVNDCAERGVKLCSDFQESSRFSVISRKKNINFRIELMKIKVNQKYL